MESVPEPGTYAMLAAGLALLGWTARRQQRQG
ncbi:MAG TPA: PEP-CTERM sorting domain-containing protein [Burkholderiaceae bacterium]|nr:PEP-CTERM sorting domain-containing protein [Burkholderiaceae bacterium]